MLLYEIDDPTSAIIRKFVRHAARRLNISTVPLVEIIRDSAYSSDKRTFGHYSPGTRELLVQIQGRHILDVLRTVAHELVHARQDELGMLGDTSGDTGSEQENQANAMAGVIMRDFAAANPQLFSETTQ
jgi:Zn-dependent peptidase ImmA (M78 family)